MGILCDVFELHWLGLLVLVTLGLLQLGSTVYVIKFQTYRELVDEQNAQTLSAADNINQASSNNDSENNQ